MKLVTFTPKLVVRQFLRATMEKHSLFALSKEDFWNRDPWLDFLRKIYLRNWLGVPVSKMGNFNAIDYGGHKIQIGLRFFHMGGSP